MSIRTRFAPSPTGHLHIGSARTALFNYLFAKHHQGKFLLRIEDTDQARSTDLAVNKIIEGLRWLNLTWDEEIVYQSKRSERHATIAKNLVEQNKAYYCYTDIDIINEKRAKALANGKYFNFVSEWRDKVRMPLEGENPVIRLKAPLDGQTIINDLVQNQVTINNNQLDDMVLLRANGTPTYMLAVVVDDYDMAISHIIRGDDHLTNTARQILLYQACGWSLPYFAHIPLIHGSDGTKLSKRHGALGIDTYQDMGYLPEAIKNYLLRLGWSHHDDEIISTNQAIEWFDLTTINKAAAKFDFKKLDNLNAHYLKEMDNQSLLDLVKSQIESNTQYKVDQSSWLLEGLDSLKVRSKNLIELAHNSLIYITDFKIKITPEALKILPITLTLLTPELIDLLSNNLNWQNASLQKLIKEYCLKYNLKLVDLAQAIRIALTGAIISPSIFEIMAIIKKDETIKRIKYLLNYQKNENFI